MAPTFKFNESVFASSLLNFGRNDVITYTAEPTPYEKITDLIPTIRGRVALFLLQKQ